MPLTRFTLRQIEALTAVAQTRNFGEAAEQLGMTTQAVSQLIAELESVLGFKVFDRTTRRVDLSSAGRDFLGSAETMLRHVHAAERAAADVRNRAAGVVRVGAPLVLASSAVPAAIQAYQATHPKVVVRVHDLAVDALVDAVAAGDVDLAVGPDRAVPAEVARHVLFDSLWVLWCARNHPLARRARLRWADLHGVALVAAGRDHERSVARMHASAPEGERVVPVEVVDNVSTALGMAVHGLAATLAPAYVGVVAEPFGLVMRRVVDPETVRKVCLYRPVARAVSPATEGFAEHLAAWLPAWSRKVLRGGGPPARSSWPSMSETAH
ncbi:LysR family transcriptional regulator [Pseudorhodoferax sp. Leaf265]|uniref:LysR family transcriptional regulator n=1 Tax=Pseudorhodoferax sp. Leaf265 TaxID=1736315 RepID=UPI0006FE147B|nr:LysR family transcriptional regulator [Pseudorhodoferax sp. Leaf265]KQP04427.1 LysR family transcriptional regulator [Pseudorhodoferax sp. Leaf265]PZP96401.1 MAG: LysR family transcriptional regulator [Variovorax paradoxus]PZQ07516.1 MAG: LysR family transcriptional regulator [Variovorax paradoxus]